MEKHDIELKATLTQSDDTIEYRDDALAVLVEKFKCVYIEAPNGSQYLLEPGFKIKIRPEAGLRKCDEA